MEGAGGNGVTGELRESSASFGPLVVTSPVLRAAHVELPEESPDPVLLPTVTLLDRAASHGGDPEGLPLPPGRLLAGQYRLIRSLGYGGMGEVYLALDTKVDHREVAIKVLHPQQAAASAGALAEERRALVDLSHGDIIRVFNYGHHPEVGDFLVLQYVDGLTLEEVRARVQVNPDEFGGRRFHEFVLAYGVRILSALGHLHADRPGKVYGDLKPDNVMHDGTSTKIIDVGSVRAAGLPGHTTEGFRAPTVGPNGESTGQDDLFSLGETLRRLSGLGRSPDDLAELGRLDMIGPPRSPGDPEGPRPPGAPAMTAPCPRGLGLVSLARVLHRATRGERAGRFATAQEMEEQLRGVFRELRSLRTGAETFEPSPLFFQSPYALDAALGSAPPLTRWAAPDAPAPYAPPSPAEVAQRLPVPRPDPHDLHHAELSRLADAAPEALLQHTGDWRDSPEVHLLRCRLRLRGAGGGTGAAERELRFAETLIGAERAPHDWRLDWHRGLLALGQDRAGAARLHFDQVFAAIPGEYAPKLALGYCAERLGRWQEALTFYEAVRLRNPSLGSAAFGAARARLALGGDQVWDDAVRALDAVPQHSRHRTAARTAAVRVGVEHVRTAGHPDEGAERLREVLARLARLFHAHGLTDEQARVRMTAEVWEAVRGALARGAIDAAGLAELAAGADARLGLPSDEPGLRRELSRLYLTLAHQAARSAAAEDGTVAETLLDRAYAVRPLAFRHHRDSPWPGKRVAAWLRTTARAGARGKNSGTAADG
ncbi:serine/threonine-protein kinase PknG [Streptomyces sp. V3I8]|uniref:serine/threonine protein kinase n=1 Tax=Streptomyces sp. V3I8 TaxID=3042279 RepID=UPI0027863226|nr:serine/threonine protein kinase [Streptomyces sp. V3I8]MDQ1040966.1 serine/threonine-protein kinase PknG [Streptomyces sp. V3I8]